MKDPEKRWVNKDTFWIGLFLSWIALLLGSYYSSRYELDNNISRLAEGHARGLFHFVKVTRLWNAKHGAVYVPVTKETPVNEHLEVPHRDLTRSDGLRLTQVNPAYMTRQLAAFMFEEGEGHIHLTSLNPLRPENAPDAWEREVLTSKRERFERVEGLTDSDTVYRYMGLLRTEESCLGCHAKQGYEVGDIRGGISVKIPAAYYTEVHGGQGRYLMWFHLIAWVIGLLTLAWFRGVSRRQLRELLTHERSALLAFIDGLTGLANRRRLDAVLKEEWGRGNRAQSTLSMIMIDVDFFKKYNDFYGHQAGDECLTQLAKTIHGVVSRSDDLVARYGGEEFAVVLPNTTLEGACHVAECVRVAIASLEIEHHGLGEGRCVTVSLGVAAALPDHESSVDALLAAADKALYQAKQGGRDRVVRASAAVTA